MLGIDTGVPSYENIAPFHEATLNPFEEPTQLKVTLMSDILLTVIIGPLTSAHVPVNASMQNSEKSEREISI